MKLCASQIAALAIVTTLAVSGCGGSDEPEDEKLPSDVTQALLERLDSISDRVAAGVSGACDDIYDESVGDIGPIDDAMASVPNDVAPEIRSALEESIDRLKQLVDDECAEISAREQQEQESVPEEEPAPLETTPDETTTEETDTETSPETTPDTDTEQPEQPQNPGRGPDGTGPPGQNDGGGVEVPSDGDDE